MSSYLILATVVGATVAQPSTWNEVGNGGCRQGKGGRQEPGSISRLSVANVEDCKAVCFSDEDCDAVEWFPLRKFWPGNWRKEKGGPNCQLKQNTVDDWITQSSGHTVTKKKGGLKNAITCFAKNEAAFTTTPPEIVTPTTIPTEGNDDGSGNGGDDDDEEPVTEPAPEPTSPPSFVLVGEGSCRAGNGNRALDTFKSTLVSTWKECGEECEKEAAESNVDCIGFDFRAGKQNRARPNAKQTKPNCKCLKPFVTKKNVVVSQITGSDANGRSANKKLKEYTLCYARD